FLSTHRGSLRENARCNFGIYRNMLKKIIILLLLFAAPAFGKDNYLYMRGYLGSELVDAVSETFEEGRDAERIIIQVDSSSGDLREVFPLAQKIYDLKLREDKYIVVYI